VGLGSPSPLLTTAVTQGYAWVKNHLEAARLVSKGRAVDPCKVARKGPQDLSSWRTFLPLHWRVGLVKLVRYIEQV
jgi:hypothetical protein